MNKTKQNTLRWKLVDLGNDIDSLKAQYRKPTPEQFDDLRNQVHEAIKALLNENKHNTGVEAEDDAKG